MSFFTSGAFWLMEGIFLCLAVIGLKVWSEDRGTPMTFWKWVYTLGWLFFVGFSLTFIGTSLGENEPAAALRGGVVLVLMAAGFGYFVLRGIGFMKRTSD